MSLVAGRPENAGPLQYLGHGQSPAEAAFGPPPPDVDRFHLGTHPDIVDRLWDTLNEALPADSRWLVFDGPSLVHPTSGVILAAGIGTQYALRLRPEDAASAVAAGAELVHRFRTVGTTLDLPATFGAGWVFGRFDEREADWLLAAYRQHAT
jgi:hypothetical protein